MTKSKSTTQRFTAARLPRRALLRGLAAAPVLGAFAPFLRARPARAQGGAPQNLVIFTWPDGLEEGWHPTGGETSFALPDVLAPLGPHRKELLVIGGLKSGMKAELNAHTEGPLTLWTGSAQAANKSLSSNRSVDEAVAQAIGAGTPFKALHLGVQAGVLGPLSSPSHVHYSAANQPAPAEDDPAAVYDQIFGKALPGQDAAKIARVRRERGTVLDFVKAQLKTVRVEVAADDRAKVDAHVEGLAAIEKSLAGLGETKCDARAPRPTLTRAAATMDANFATVGKLQTDLLVLALQCGVTRVATLQLSNTDSQLRLPGINPNYPLHGVMHDRPTAERVAINRFFVGQMAYLIERLKGVSLGGGRTLLDETLVVFGSEMAVGNHKNGPMPFFVAGGGGAYFKLGRWLHLPNQPRHTKLLTSIAQAMGMAGVATYGEFKEPDSTGPLSEVRG